MKARQGITAMNKEIERFIALLREVQKIDPEFPVQYAICLAFISRHEGIGLTELARMVRMPLSTVSRIVGAPVPSPAKRGTLRAG